MIIPGKSSIGFSCFEKLTFLVEISKFSKIPEISKFFEKALLLYELSEREPGWRFTARCHFYLVAVVLQGTILGSFFEKLQYEVSKRKPR